MPSRVCRNSNVGMRGGMVKAKPEIIRRAGGRNRRNTETEIVNKKYGWVGAMQSAECVGSTTVRNSKFERASPADLHT
jgi:hypothetical protein